MEGFKNTGDFEEVGIIRINDAPINMIITDPCYKIGTWCTARLSVKPGDYKCFVEYYFDKEYNYSYVASMEARHVDSLDIVPTLESDEDIGVDSASCGIYNLSYYINHSESCKIPIPYGSYYRLTNKGLTCISGFGDGRYSLYLGYNKQSQIVSVKVKFISFDEK